MPRVSANSIQKLNAFLDSLPDEAKTKCALCTETLTHIVKMAEVKTGVGTATVTNAIAERHNKTAAQQDRVTGKALNERVRYNEGLKSQSEKIKSDPDENTPIEKFNPSSGILKQDTAKPKMTLQEKQAIRTEDYRISLEVYFRVIRIAKQTGFKETSKEAIMQDLNMLFDVVTIT